MWNGELDFETEIAEEDKDVNDAIENIIAILKKQMEKDGGNVSIVAPAQMQRLANTYRTVKRMTNGIKGVKVLCEVNEPFTSMGSISVIGRNIAFNNPELFMRSVKAANSFEVYPKTDGTVQMNFTFHGLTTVVAKNK